MSEMHKSDKAFCFLNQLPADPITLKIGEIKEASTKKGMNFYCEVGTPFVRWDSKEKQEETVQGPTIIHWQHVDRDGNPSADGNAIQKAMAGAGCFLGDTVTVTQTSPGVFEAMPGGKMAAPRQTTAQALEKAQAPPPVMQGFSKPPVQAVDIVRVFAYFLVQAQEVLKSQGLNDASTETIVSVAQTMTHKGLDDRTTIPVLLEGGSTEVTEDDLDF